MKTISRSTVLILLAIALFLPVAQAQTASVTAKDLSAEEMRVFLAEAPIVKERRSSKGVTDTRVATLSDGRRVHDAQIQIVDEARALFEAGRKSEVNFKDTYKFNIAGYELARLLGLDNVPMSVERKVQGKMAAMTWWLDDLLMVDGKPVDEEVRVKKKITAPEPIRFSRQIQIMRIFDELIQNVDRNQGNAMWDKNWTLWMVDHTRAFRLGQDLKKPEDLVWCERGLLDGLRRLTADALTNAVGKNLTKQEVDAVMARRDLIVKHYEALIARRGEDVVLFTLGPTTVATR